MPRPLAPGLYESLFTAALADAVRDLDAGELRVERAPLDLADAERPLARHLAGILAAALRAVDGSPAERLESQLDIVNRLLAHLQRALPDDPTIPGALLPPPPEELRAIRRRGALPGDDTETPRPGIPLSTSALLVNGRDEHRIGHELQRELVSADGVDLVCAFIRWQGLRLLERELKQLCGARKPFRVLTTVYCGATEAPALDALVDWGADLKVSYDNQRTRLHAKAWLFRRDTGFSTAYIGSSNLSASALLDGLEWNVRLSAVENPHVLDRFAAAFESYWQDPEFETYSHVERPRFERAVRRQTSDPAEQLVGLDLEPYPFQREILAKLDAERVLHGRWKNLIVAATGTGKTVMAALDYRRIRQQWREARLLFVAHRKEILTQSRSVFRAALRDGSFGERWVDGERPVDGQHVFASIQTLARADLDRLPRDAFDVVIVDEVHHAEAPTYERLLERVRPRLLLGLTATPERADGRSILPWFDGRIAAELRLWTALERQLLAPFQYFAVHDDADRHRCAGHGAGIRRATSRTSTPSAARARGGASRSSSRRSGGRSTTRRRCAPSDSASASRMPPSWRSSSWQRHPPSPSSAPRTAMPGRPRPRPARRTRERDLHRRSLQRGRRRPQVDTILFLRPTESATVFLQQLGRGLRRTEGKTCCTVLDFIARPNRRFRFDLASGHSSAARGGRGRQIADGFPVLPAGCAIDLDRESRGIVLTNLRRASGPAWATRRSAEGVRGGPRA
jgi:superfamily II DNA or RNA helicase